MSDVTLEVATLEVIEVTTGVPGPQGEPGTSVAKGDKGDTGDTGPQGPKGDTGDTGPQGPAGDDGLDGADGATGAKGDKGDKGDTGDTGPQGPKGDTGNTGATGAAGTNGTNGATGATGATGAKGDKGDTGAGVPTGGATSAALLKVSGTDYDTAWTPLTDAHVAAVAPNDQTGTTYTFVAADASRLVRSSNSSAQSFTIPANSSVAFPKGTVLQVAQQGTAAVSFVTGGTPTLRTPHGAKTAARYAIITAVKVDTDEWYVTGDVTT